MSNMITSTEEGKDACCNFLGESDGQTPPGERSGFQSLHMCDWI